MDAAQVPDPSIAIPERLYDKCLETEFPIFQRGLT